MVLPNLIPIPHRGCSAGALGQSLTPKPNGHAPFVSPKVFKTPRLAIVPSISTGSKVSEFKTPTTLKLSRRRSEITNPPFRKPGLDLWTKPPCVKTSRSMSVQVSSSSGITISSSREWFTTPAPTRPAALKRSEFQTPIHTPYVSRFGEFHTPASSSAETPEVFSSAKCSSTPKIRPLTYGISSPLTPILTPNNKLLISRVTDNSSPTPSIKIAYRGLTTNDLRFYKLLGTGGFGSVYLGAYRGRKVAIKCLHTHVKNKAAQYESYKAELLVLKLKHTNIIRTFAASHPECFTVGAFLVMEYVNGNNLQQMINDCNPSDFNCSRRYKYAIQLASALEYTHESGIAHLDVKPANVLVTDNDMCKLGDFGCSRVIGTGTRLTNASPTDRSSLTGTFAYRAPELLRGDAASHHADVYSYGVTLWQMASREFPYAGENQHVIIFGVVAYNLRPRDLQIEEGDRMEVCYRDLYKQCWEATPGARPSSADIVKKLRARMDSQLRPR